MADSRCVSHRSRFARFSWRERAKALEKPRFWRIKSDWFRSIWRNFQSYLADDARTPREKDRRARNRRDPPRHVDRPADPQGRSGRLEKRVAAVDITDDDGATSRTRATGQTRQFRLRPPRRRGPAGPGSPPIKPEGGRENPTPGLAVRSLNRSDTSGIVGLSNRVR